MSEEVADRVAAGVRAAWQRIVGYVAGGSIYRTGGLLVTLTNLADQELQSAFVESPPMDAPTALADADRWVSGQGHALSLDLERGRHPTVEEAAGALGLRPIVSRPGMAAQVEDLALGPLIPGVEIGRVRDAADLAAFVDIQVEVFQMKREVAEDYIPLAALTAPGVALHLAKLEGTPVGCCAAYVDHGTVGVFGVATIQSARRRGIGTAVTAGAIDDARGRVDLAWLQSSDEGRSVYQRMGFRPISDWVVWAGSSAGP